MTHDELLAHIDKYLIPTMKQEPNFNGAIGILKSLRAVVELHKPSSEDFFKEIGCMGCGINSEYADLREDYPCPTILAIEKELK